MHWDFGLGRNNCFCQKFGNIFLKIAGKVVKFAPSVNHPDRKSRLFYGIC